MNKLPADLYSFFHASINGFEQLKSEAQNKNIGLIKQTYEALLKEEKYTDADIDNLRVLIILFRTIRIDSFRTAREFISVEYYLIGQVSNLSANKVRMALSYLAGLLFRGGILLTNVLHLGLELAVWRKLQRFTVTERSFICGFIDWLQKKKFTFASINGIITELIRLKGFFQSLEIDDLERINNHCLYEYLVFVGVKSKKRSSRQKILSNIKPLLHYVKETINPLYKVPEYQVREGKVIGAISRAKPSHIQKLEASALNEDLDLECRLIIKLILQYQVHVKVLPFFMYRPAESSIVFSANHSCLVGESTFEIKLTEEIKTLVEQYLAKKKKSSLYLFSSVASIKLCKPVSKDYFEGRIKSFTANNLGESITGDFILRGQLFYLARKNNLTEFLDLTKHSTVSQKRRIMYWINSNQ